MDRCPTPRGRPIHRRKTTGDHVEQTGNLLERTRSRSESSDVRSLRSRSRSRGGEMDKDRKRRCPPLPDMKDFKDMLPKRKKSRPASSLGLPSTETLASSDEDEGQTGRPRSTSVSSHETFRSEGRNSSPDSVKSEQRFPKAKMRKLKKKQRLEMFQMAKINPVNTKLSPAEPTEPCTEDWFCWSCHRDGKQMLRCTACPRVFHLRCTKLTALPTKDDGWVCQICRSISSMERSDTRVGRIPLEQLGFLFSYAIQTMKECEGSEPFWKAVDTEVHKFYRHYVAYPMDLSLLEENVRKKSYGCTEAFEADAKWILHNCTVFNAPQHDLTTVAKKLMRACSGAMNAIESCPDCYLKSFKSPEDFFTDICPLPHLPVWAKLKGFPYWPAKVIRMRGEEVEVRFFGDHDRSHIQLKHCLLYSEESPLSYHHKKGLDKLKDAVEEMQVYIAKLEDKFGKFYYSEVRTPFDPNKQMEQLLACIPGYKDGETPSYVPATESVTMDVRVPALMDMDSLMDSAKKVDSPPRADSPDPGPPRSVNQSDWDQFQTSVKQINIINVMTIDKSDFYRPDSDDDHCNYDLLSEEADSPHSSPTLVGTLDSPPTLAVTPHSSPTLTTTLDSSPTLAATPHSSPTVVLTLDSSPTLGGTPNSSPTMATTLDSSPTLAATPQSSPNLIVTLDASPTLVATLDSSPTLATTPNSSRTLVAIPNSSRTLVTTPNSSLILVTTPNSSPTQPKIKVINHSRLMKPRPVQEPVKPITNNKQNGLRVEPRSLEGEMEVDVVGTAEDNHRSPRAGGLDQGSAMVSEKMAVDGDSDDSEVDVETEVPGSRPFRAIASAKPSHSPVLLNNTCRSNKASDVVVVIDDDPVVEPDRTETYLDPKTGEWRSIFLPDESGLLDKRGVTVSVTKGSFETRELGPTVALSRGVSLSVVKGRKQPQPEGDVTLASLLASPNQRSPPRQTARKTFGQSPRRASNSSTNSRRSSSGSERPMVVIPATSSGVTGSSVPLNLLQAQVRPGGGHNTFPAPPTRPRLPPPPPGVWSTSIQQQVLQLINEAIQERATGDPSASLVTLQMELDKRTFMYTQEVNELKHHFNLSFAESQACFKSAMEQSRQVLIREHQRTLEETQRAYEKKLSELERAVEMAKKKQWCTVCGDEAQLYCCWNTSYCDYACQETHWKVHMEVCRQKEQNSGEPEPPDAGPNINNNNNTASLKPSTLYQGSNLPVHLSSPLRAPTPPLRHINQLVTHTRINKEGDPMVRMVVSTPVSQSPRFTMTSSRPPTMMAVTPRHAPPTMMAVTPRHTPYPIIVPRPPQVPTAPCGPVFRLAAPVSTPVLAQRYLNIGSQKYVVVESNRVAGDKNNVRVVAKPVQAVKRGGGNVVLMVSNKSSIARPSGEGGPRKLNTDPVKLNTDPVKLNTDPVKLNTDPIKLNTDPVKLNTESPKLCPEPVKSGQELTRLNPEPVKSSQELLRLIPEPAKLCPEPVKSTQELTRGKPEPPKLGREPVKSNGELAKLNPEPVKSGQELTRLKPEPVKSSQELTRLIPEPPMLCPEPVQFDQGPSVSPDDTVNKVQKVSPTPE